MTTAERFHELINPADARQDLAGRSVRAAVLTAGIGFADFAIRIGSTAILSRLVLPEHFGLVMMATAVIAVADQLRDLGLSSATVQRANVTLGEVTNLFWVNVAFSGLIALGIAACSPWIAAYYHDPRLGPIACIMGATVFLNGLTVQHQSLLTRQLKLGHTAAVRLLSSLVSTLLAIALAWLDFGYWALLWREVARALLLSAGMWACFRWVPGLPEWKTDIRDLLRFGANLTGANILASVTSGIDRFLLGRMWGAATVAIYRQSFQLVTTPTDQLLNPLYNVAQPALCLLQGDATRFRRFFLKLLTLVCILTMPLSLFVAVYADTITAVVLGPSWMASAPILCILSIGTFIKQAIGATACVLIARGRSATYLGLTVLQNAVLVVCMFIGIRWGAEGIAIADVTATYLLIGPRLHYSLKDSPVSLEMFFATIARPFAASLGMAGSLLLLRAAIPEMSLALALISASVVAVIAFGATWISLPGGKAELGTLLADLRSALQGATRRVSPGAAVPAAAN